MGAANTVGVIAAPADMKSMAVVIDTASCHTWSWMNQFRGKATTAPPL